MRIAIVPDFAEERWPSMDLCAEMLQANLPESASLCPPYRRIFAKLSARRATFNADRLVNRHFVQPHFLKRQRNRFDAFHIVDHSYAHLVHSLPAERTGVFCHDLDAFRCLIEPRRDPRPLWFRAMARRILRGMQRAAVVFHSTAVVRAEIERFGLIDPSRLVLAPYGISAEFTPDAPKADLPLAIEWPYLLHVGSNVPRKRIDVLLDVFAAVRLHHPEIRLIKLGPEFTAVQQSQIGDLRLSDGIVRLENLPRRAVAALYRHAAVVLQPSESEGFGLPLAEALACGATVLASDIAVLREVGGDGADYIPVADVGAWAAAVEKRLAGRSRREVHFSRRFSWAVHAATIAAAYERLVG
jgi:glycosyltransferase involved in cell wall biosynthesis